MGAGRSRRNSCQRPSDSRSGAISGERNSPQTLWRGKGDFSTMWTEPVSDRAAIAAAEPAGPPPMIRTELEETTSSTSSNKQRSEPSNDCRDPSGQPLGTGCKKVKPGRDCINILQNGI